jgi:hypothetical protein
MDQFYTIVVVVAVVVLLLILIGIGMMLQKQNKEVTFPLYANECPDGWIATGDGCKMPQPSHSNYPSKPTLLSKFNAPGNMYNLPGETIEAGTVLSFNTAATTCQKRQWAQDVGVSWDGITNYNKC